MRRSLLSRAVGGFGLLLSIVAPTLAQTPGQPVAAPAGMSAASPPLAVPVTPTAPTASATPILLPARAPGVTVAPLVAPVARPVVVQTAEPPTPAPRLGGVVPVSHAPVAPQTPSAPASADSRVSSITLNETIERTEALHPRAPRARQPALGQPALPATTAVPPSGMSALFPRAEPVPKRKSFVDLSAAPCFAHAPDYKWVLGRVEYSSVAKEWRIRYASVDETDRYGGRVALIENYHVGLLREGTYVQARGHLVNPQNTSNGSTYFRIESFQVVQNPNSEQPGQEPSNNVAFGRTK